MADAARSSRPACYCRDACARNVSDSTSCDLPCPGPAAATTNRTSLGSGRGTCLRSQWRTSLHALKGDDHVHIAGGLLAQREQRLVFGGIVPGIETVHVRKFDDDDPLRFPMRPFRE